MRASRTVGRDVRTPPPRPQYRCKRFAIYKRHGFYLTLATGPLSAASGICHQYEIPCMGRR